MMRLSTLVVVFTCATLLSCNDPVHDAEVTALGPEVGGVTSASCTGSLQESSVAHVNTTTSVERRIMGPLRSRA